MKKKCRKSGKVRSTAMKPDVIHWGTDGVMTDTIEIYPDGPAAQAGEFNMKQKMAGAKNRLAHALRWCRRRKRWRDGRREKPSGK